MSGLVRHVWVGGKDPGVMIADVDPPLQPGEVEIDIEDGAWREITDVELTRLGARIVRDGDAVTHAKRT